ncbi:MAG: VacJ family lipoprotein, partial [Nitrospiraceae bacterium]
MPTARRPQGGGTLSRWGSETARLLVSVVLAIGAGGCASLSEQFADGPGNRSVRSDHASLSAALQSTSPTDVGYENSVASTAIESREDLATAQLIALSEEGTEEETPAAEDDEFLDPFETEATVDLEEYDPWESYNVFVFKFNYNFDQYLLKPVAKGYNFIMPTFLQLGFANAFHNLRVVPRLLNNVFQGKFKGAGLEVSRFLINSTIGIGGLFDPARTEFGLETPDEDFGQTLAVYGVGPGPYLMLPFLPPSTVRDTVGFVVDIFLDPYNWLIFKGFSAGQDALVDEDNTTSSLLLIGIRAFEILNLRSLNLEKFEGVEETTLDLYTAVR